MACPYYEDLKKRDIFVRSSYCYKKDSKIEYSVWANYCRDNYKKCPIYNAKQGRR